MGNITEIKTQAGNTIQKGETLHAETLRYEEFKQVNTGTAEDLLSDEETQEETKTHLAKHIESPDIFAIWERENSKRTLLTRQKQSMHEIILII